MDFSYQSLVITHICCAFYIQIFTTDLLLLGIKDPHTVTTSVKFVKRLFSRSKDNYMLKGIYTYEQ